MAHEATKWHIGDLSKAMANAIFQRAHNRFLRQKGDMVQFNGFWRDGNKQNVCAWLNKATWHDAKTGEGGGCKEFAKVAFNMSLPEFMKHYGNLQQALTRPPSATPNHRTSKSANALAVSYVDQVWKEIRTRDQNRHDYASDWLEQERGMRNPRAFIGSGFACIEKKDVSLFDIHHHGFIKNRLSIGSQLIAPIRSVYSEKIQNLFFRTISKVNKNEKSRLLPDCGGWNEKDGSPRAFGFPHLINDFSKLILCEGMADYFAAECLLGGVGDFLPIGAANAGALKHWADWLSVAKYKGKVIILYQLDIGPNGKVSSHAIGQIKATEAFKTLLQNRVSGSLFRWASFLRLIKANEPKFNDLADAYKLFGDKDISEQFLTTLKESN